MNSTTILNKSLNLLLKPIGFTQGSDKVMRRWNIESTICCAIALKVFIGREYATLEVGFISPQIHKWSELSTSEFPQPFEANGFGVFYRLKDFEIQDGFVFPPGGWKIVSLGRVDIDLA